MVLEVNIHLYHHQNQEAKVLQEVSKALLAVEVKGAVEPLMVQEGKVNILNVSKVKVHNKLLKIFDLSDEGKLTVRFKLTDWKDPEIWSMSKFGQVCELL